MSILLSVTYEDYCEKVDMELTDSIINIIENRKDSKITKEFPKLQFIDDTVSFNEDYIIFSEPFYVSEDRLLWSMLFWSKNEENRNQWSFFIKNVNDKLIIEYFYDWKQNKYLENVEYSPADRRTK